MHYSKYLLDYEKTEILDYEQVYYINTRYPKLMGSSPKGVENHGFDAQNAEYICEDGDHIGYRYEIIKSLGKGSFGQVYKCFDHKDKQYVAMKILLNKKRLFKQGLVEKKILETLRDNDPEDKKNVVRILGSVVFRNHLILIFEMLSVNLYDFLKLNCFKGISLNLARRFAI